MSKGERRSRATGEPQEPLTHPASARSSRWMGPAVVGGLGVLVVFAYLNLTEMRGIHGVLDARLDQIDTRLLQLSSKVEQAGTRPASVAGGGPDPNRVYAVKTDGAPFKGPAAAAITIAEFSDFQ